MLAASETGFGRLLEKRNDTEGSGAGQVGWAELKLSLRLTHWPQVHLWGTRYKLRAEPLLGPLLTTATPQLLLLSGPSFQGKGLEMALIFQEQRGQLTDVASSPSHPLLYSLPLLGYARTSATLKRRGKTKMNEAERQRAQTGLKNQDHQSLLHLTLRGSGGT